MRLVLPVFAAALLLACSGSAPTAAPPAAGRAPAATSAPPAAGGAAQPVTDATSAPRALVKVPIGYSVLSGDPLAIFIAAEQGLFARNGIDPELVYIGGSTRIVESMIAGEIKMGQIAGSSGVSAVLAGADIVFLGSLAPTFVMSVFGRPEISSVADLRGKTVAVTARGATTDFAAQVALRRAGMDPLRDATIVATGGIQETLSALLSGGVQAGVFPPPTSLQARDAGLRELVNLAAERVPYDQGTLGTTRRYMQDNPELVRGFLRAIVEGIAVAKRDRALAKSVLSKYTKNEDDAALEETYHLFVDEALPRVPLTSVEGVQNVLDLLDNPRAREARPEQFVDNSYVRELEASGYIQRLYE